MTHGDIIWSILAALAVILTQIASYLKSRKERRANHADTSRKLDHVQETVNGQTQALHGRIDQLSHSLSEAGVDIPNGGERT